MERKFDSPNTEKRALIAKSLWQYGGINIGAASEGLERQDSQYMLDSGVNCSELPKRTWMRTRRREKSSDQGTWYRVICETIKVWPWSNLTFYTPLTKTYIYASMDIACHTDAWICSSSGNLQIAGATFGLEKKRKNNKEMASYRHSMPVVVGSPRKTWCLERVQNGAVFETPTQQVSSESSTRCYYLITLESSCDQGRLLSSR